MRLIKSSFIALWFVTASSVLAADCQTVPKYAEPHVSGIVIQKWLGEIQGSKEVECRKLGGNVLQCFKDVEIWLFTELGHPAHPAMSHAALIDCNVQTYISRNGYYAGNQKAFDTWFSELKKYDEDTIRRFRQAQ